jgi:CheY-like chemotaxis protein
VRKKILVAAAPAATELIASALYDVASVRVAHTLEDAKSAIAGGVDLIIVGTFFDGSRMFDLVRLVKSNPTTKHVPVICARAIIAPGRRTSAVEQPILSNLEIVSSASKSLGAEGFLDFCQRQIIVGIRAAQEELADLARSHLGDRPHPGGAC